ncbi:MAG: shikimate kinase [Clostridia bacterium]|nr:shikimate kinase [Clostridia bacterium]
MKNIVLIGMPGSGKSTIGVLLAKAVGMPFVDTDIVIQQETGRLLQDIINKDGIKSFLEIEERVVSRLNLKDHVIATGGSVVYSRRAMERLQSNSIIVYLQLTYEEVEARIKNITTRGIAMEKGQTLYDLYQERIALYEQYQDMVIPCTGKSVEEVIGEVKKKIESKLGLI